MNGRKLIPGKPLPPSEIPDYSIRRDTLDETFAEAFRERLRRIAEIVKHSGEPLEGNIFYRDGDERYADEPPADELAPARRNVWRAVRFKERLLEVGVNAGHSALLALSSNSEARILRRRRHVPRLHGGMRGFPERGVPGAGPFVPRRFA